LRTAPVDQKSYIHNMRETVCELLVERTLRAETKSIDGEVSSSWPDDWCHSSGLSALEPKSCRCCKNVINENKKIFYKQRKVRTDEAIDIQLCTLASVF